MKSVKSQFEAAMRKVVFPADMDDGARRLCRAMFDAGRRSMRNEKHRQAVAVRKPHKTHKEPTS